SAVAALTEVSSADESELTKLISTIDANYLQKYEENKKHWGGGIMGSKANDKIAKKAKIAASAASANRDSGALTSGALTSGALTSGALTSGALTSGALTSGALTSGALTSRTSTSRAMTSDRL
ncbi:RPL8B, partial [Candida oxycetoniae]